MDVHKSYSLIPEVTIRSERFGGLIFNHNTGKLQILYSRELVEVLLTMDSSRSIKSTLEDISEQYGLLAAAVDSLIAALIQLENIGIIDEVL